MAAPASLREADIDKARPSPSLLLTFTGDSNYGNPEDTGLKN